MANLMTIYDMTLLEESVNMSRLEGNAILLLVVSTHFIDGKGQNNAYSRFLFRS